MYNNLYLLLNTSIIKSKLFIKIMFKLYLYYIYNNYVLKYNF